jgi:heme-degrading monooxygenase HmoA
VFRRAEDPNDVVVLQDVADEAKARAWFASDDLKAAMQKGGVIGAPSIRFAA